MSQTIRVLLSSGDSRVVDQAADLVTAAATNASARSVGPGPLTLRAAKNPETLPTHRRLVDILDPSQELVDALLRLNLPSGVDINVRLVAPHQGSAVPHSRAL